VPSAPEARRKIAMRSTCSGHIGGHDTPRNHFGGSPFLTRRSIQRETECPNRQSGSPDGGAVSGRQRTHRRRRALQGSRGGVRLRLRRPQLRRAALNDARSVRGSALGRHDVHARPRPRGPGCGTSREAASPTARHRREVQ
jgi:hypothetical protein